MDCPASFSYGNLFPTLNFVPHAVDAGSFLVIPDDLRLTGTGNLKPPGNLPEPPCTLSLPPDLFCSGSLNDLDLRLPAETTVEDEQENYDGCYFKNVVYVHAITPCSDIV